MDGVNRPPIVATAAHGCTLEPSTNQMVDRASQRLNGMAAVAEVPLRSIERRLDCALWTLAAWS